MKSVKIQTILIKELHVISSREHIVVDNNIKAILSFQSSSAVCQGELQPLCGVLC